MSGDEIKSQLEELAATDANDFALRTDDLADSWAAAGAGLEVVEPVLRFIESGPQVDFGTPGPLVHFIERFHKRGYEEKLLESLARKPTGLTTWLLHRLLNGTKEPAARQQLIAVFKAVQTHPLAEPEAVERANRYLERLG
jgi:hypothetical protein